MIHEPGWASEERLGVRSVLGRYVRRVFLRMRLLVVPWGNTRSTSRLSLGWHLYGAEEEATFARLVDGVLAALFALRVFPVVRCARAPGAALCLDGLAAL